MWAARVVCWGFDLGPEAGYEILRDHYNPRCEPPWDEADLRRKCNEAMDPDFRHPRGWLLEADRPAPRRQYSSALVPTPAAATPAAPQTQSGRIPFVRNYRVRALENGGSDRVGLTPQQIAADVLALTGGWPKAVAGRLFIATPDHKVRWLDDPTELFGWLAGLVGQGGGLVEWARGEGALPKAEFFEYLCGSVEQFDDVQTVPHVPPRSGTYYVHPPLPGGWSGAFDELLCQFNPATDTDRALVRSFFLTLLWGGRLGGRPVFIFESAAADGPGQGSGKSTVVMLAGKLFGDPVSISLATADDVQVQTRLLSEAGLASRLVVFDNLKGTRVSSSLIESYVTAPRISGRQLYVGEGSRPNILTWCITANQPSLSKDFVQRAFPVKIAPPVYSPEWNDETDRLIETCRWQILADMAEELQADPRWTLGPGEYSRWPNWERDVLCRVCDAREIRADVAERRGQLDDDDATTGIIRDALAQHLSTKRLGGEAEQLHVTFTAATAAEALGKLCPHGPSQISVGRWLASLTIQGLSKRRTKHARFWVWKGEAATADEPIEWEELPRPIGFSIPP